MPTESAPIEWEDPRFPPAIEAARKSCGVDHHHDDAMFAMLLDVCDWDHEKVQALYAKSARRRRELGLAEIREHIISEDLAVERFPHHEAVRRIIPIFSSASLVRPSPPSSSVATAGEGGASGGAAGDAAASAPSAAGDVIGCYEMRHGQGETEGQDPEAMPITPDQFATYMMYVTQWRWLQCERYAQAHGRVGYWSMIHDLSCPQGFFALWHKARAVFSSYLRPVDEACGGLFPPMVQKILVINVPRLFSPVWAVISRVLPEQHKARIVLLTSSQTTPDNLAPYLHESLQPPHIRADALAGGWPEPADGAAAIATSAVPDAGPVAAAAMSAGGAPQAEAAGWLASAAAYLPTAYFSSYAAVPAPAPASPAPPPPHS